AIVIAELAAMVKNVLCEALPQLVLHGLSRKLFDGLLDFAAELLVRFVAPCKPDHGEAGGEIAVGRDVVERGNEFAVREIASRAENHHGAWLRHGPAGEAFAQRIDLWFIRNDRAHGGSSRWENPPVISMRNFRL